MVTVKGATGAYVPGGDKPGDALVKMKLNHEKRATTIKHDTLHPVWNEKFEWLMVRAHPEPLSWSDKHMMRAQGSPLTP